MQFLLKTICTYVKLLDGLNSAQISESKSNFSFPQNPKAESYLRDPQIQPAC